MYGYPESTDAKGDQPSPPHVPHEVVSGGDVPSFGGFEASGLAHHCEVSDHPALVPGLVQGAPASGIVVSDLIRTDASLAQLALGQVRSVPASERLVSDLAQQPPS